MTTPLDITFARLDAAPAATCAAFAGSDLSLSPAVQALNTKSQGLVLKAAEAAEFKAKAKSSIEILAPQKLDIQRLLLIGVGKAGEHDESDWASIGGYTFGQITARKAREVSVIAEVSGADHKPEIVAANLAYGALLRNYSFKKYHTKKNGDDANGADGAADRGIKLTIHCTDPDKARAAFETKRAVASGICFARDLVNEPANVLGPVEFADRVKELESIGLEVEILDDVTLKELGMNTLLSVAQGSVRPARVAIMQWHGAKSKRAKPLAFVGKGVVFDTGGISIKPAAGMEDMKGDMGGAAAVTGLMVALAERKAPVNAVGILGIVENMPSGSAIRPGDIVVSLSGQTVENLNTDAEGRLVLADVLWYVQERFKPRLVVDLATLTGAIMIALGKDFAGLFANDDKLADQLIAASKTTGEKVWRMPLDKSYDKLMDSKNADVKNMGGRWGGACTAAAFLNRFIKKDVPWAHLDIAGTAMDAPKNEISTSWASGWGVQLLDRFIADNYEKAEK
ncbi:MAG: leucyl aminopeptidase [Hyphomicrobium sp.]|jgi:leucyl aminopeptidase|uniref:leucyl aminopeptidase n=1 Tax=Hyphomicrobium sp. TaxID=82 RepID=UPI0025B84C95|nr:leucyl aminopeptidase [Hyphomicrobium sp.]MBX9861286.1 leucyl aminopeptidase [Hyphomicrobium sp.]